MKPTSPLSETAPENPSPVLYPLGRNIFASIKTWRKTVKVHIRHYATPTNTKGGRLVPTQRGVALDLKEFERLVKVKKKLREDYKQQLSSLPSVKQSATEPERKKIKAQTSSLQLPMPGYSFTEDNSATCMADATWPAANTGYLQQLPESSTSDDNPGTHDLPVYNPHRDSFVFRSMGGHEQQ